MIPLFPSVSARDLRFLRFLALNLLGYGTTGALLFACAASLLRVDDAGIAGIGFVVGALYAGIPAAQVFRDECNVMLDTLSRCAMETAQDHFSVTSAYGREEAIGMAQEALRRAKAQLRQRRFYSLDIDSELKFEPPQADLK